MNLSILIVGHAQVGKKSYLSRILTGEYKSFLTTRSHTLNTSYGAVTITYRVASHNMEGYDGYIFMYDVNRPETSQFTENARGTTVFVANKCDKNITSPIHHSVSAKWNKNLYDPILEILRAEVGQDLQLLENDAIAPPTMNIVVPIWRRIIRF